MERPVRLLWLIDSLTVGGAESLIVPFARGLDRKRFDLQVCCLSTITGNPIEQRLREEGVTVTNLNARRLRDVRAFRALKQLVRDDAIDLVHAHLTYSAIWSAFLSRQTAVPAVASLHVAPSAMRAVQTSRRQIVMTSLRDRLMRFAVNRWSSMVIMVSDALRQTYLAGGGINAAKMRVVHNGIEVERFRRNRAAARDQLVRELDLPADAPIVVTVSVLRPGKGIDVLLEAARSVADAQFVIIGDGPKREEWSEAARRAGIAERVRWAGYRRDVDAILAGCDLFAHPSVDDAFPTVLLEAMAAGLPIVASRVGGIPEIVEPDVTGLLVPPNDSHALTTSIVALLSDEPRLMRMSEAARDIAGRRFSTAAWIERLTVVYDEVLQEGREA